LRSRAYVGSVSDLDELRAKVEASRAALADRDREARYRQVDAAVDAAAHVALENEFEREQWRQAQIANGVAAEEIDVDRRVVTSLPLGPVHVMVGTDDNSTAIVTYHPESDEAEKIRQSPARGVELAEGQAVNDAAHVPFEVPPDDLPMGARL
jgi:hypothetical protein